MGINVRLAGALFFKNLIKRKWTDEDGNYKLPQADVVALKQEIIQLMITLPAALQVQVGEAVSIIADSDFPDRWSELIPELVSRLGADYKVNNGVLTVAHSIFKRWRPLFRSDELFREIKLVLDQFAAPFLSVLQETDSLIQHNEANEAVLPDLFHSLHLLTKIHFDLNCQDIPEFFEDNLDTCMGIFHKYLTYSNRLLDTDSDDEATIVDMVKTSICEILILYTQRYEDVFGRLANSFVEIIWHLLTSTGMEPKYDLLVNRALGFLTATAKIKSHAEVFASEQVLEQVVKNIILINVSLRPSDEELFEDDPIEFTRRDMEGSDSDSRRRAATDFLRELADNFEAKVTQVVMTYVNGYLANYASNKANWKDKDAASYLFSSIAAKGTTTTAGVSATNILVDVVEFFTVNIAPDLISTDVNPLLTVNAIKYIYTFRNQLTKEQLSHAFPLLSNHLSSQTYVVYSYAAITIERILALRTDGAPMFQKSDIAAVAQDLLSKLFGLILRGGSTPEKLAENEFLMKCIMRILVVAQDTISPYAEAVLKQLVEIVNAISKNPSNPKFNHFTFESIGSVIRFSSQSLGADKMESIVLTPFLSILGEDVTEFIPYIIQILTQLLLARPAEQGLSHSYQQLIRPLLAPSLWEAKGNAPALVGLLQAILSHGGQVMIESGSLEPLLGVFQKLISSKVNDQYGYDLLEDIFTYIPLTALEQFVKQIDILLLQRLQTSRTERFTTRFSRFVCFLAAAENLPGLGPQFAVQFVDLAQEGIFGQVFEPFILTPVAKVVGLRERKIVAVGLTKILLQDPKLLEGVYSSKWMAGISTLVKLFQVNIAEPITHDDLNVDLDDLSFGASFSKLGTIAVKAVDLAPSVKSPQEYFIQEFRRAGASRAGALPDDVKQYLASIGV